MAIHHMYEYGATMINHAILCNSERGEIHDRNPQPRFPDIVSLSRNLGHLAGTGMPYTWIRANATRKARHVLKLTNMRDIRHSTCAYNEANRKLDPILGLATFEPAHEPTTAEHEGRTRPEAKRPGDTAAGGGRVSAHEWNQFVVILAHMSVIAGSKWMVFQPG